MTRSLLKLGGAAAALVLAATGCSAAESGSDGIADGETITLRFSSHVPDNAAVSVGIKHWMKLVTEATDGRVQFEEHWNGTLLPGEELLPALKDGRADMGWVAGLYYPSDLPLTSLGAMPFIALDPSVQTTALNELSSDNDAVADEWAAAGARPIYFTPVGGEIIGASKPIDSLDDLKNKRIRALGFTAQALDAVDATPVGLAPAEVYESIDRGVIEGFTEMPLDASVQSYSLHEVAPNYVDFGAGTYSPLAVAISASKWDSLPDDVKEAIESVSEDYYEFALADLAKAEEAACATLYKAGGTMTVLSDEDKAQWAATAEGPVTDSWLDNVTGAGVEEPTARGVLSDYKSIVDKLAAESTSVPGAQACAEANQ